MMCSRSASYAWHQVLWDDQEGTPADRVLQLGGRSMLHADVAHVLSSGMTCRLCRQRSVCEAWCVYANIR